MAQAPVNETGRLGNIVRDYGVTILVAVAIALLIRNYLLEAYRIPSGSMRPALLAGDTIFVAKWPFPGRTPDYGDVVVFSWVLGESQRESIKRVIGRPGDTVEIRQGQAFLNGQPLGTARPARSEAVCADERAGQKTFIACREPPIAEDLAPTQVKNGQVFLLSDTRSQAPELGGAPIWAMVPVDAIKGQALWIWLSVLPERGLSSGFSRIRFERMFEKVN